MGGSLRDSGDEARENYISSQGAEYFAQLYKEDGLKGGHVILLNPPSSDYFGATKRQALAALEAYPGGLQIGGGITAENAEEYLEAGASHVIVTSYVFLDGEVRYNSLKRSNPEKAAKLFAVNEAQAKARYAYLKKLITLYGAEE